jgi:protein tyrosine/serine phosphatase
VHDGLYRGGHPDAAGLDYLKQIGVKTIIDLEIGDFIEAYPWSITEEQDGAADRGLTLIREPMSAFEPAVLSGFDVKIDAIMAILRDKGQGPVYVHCLHGQDRTGLVIGLERVLIEGWAPKDAHDEMVARGFHTGFIGLDEYFDRKTGWEDD